MLCVNRSLKIKQFRYGHFSYTLKSQYGGGATSKFAFLFYGNN